MTSRQLVLATDFGRAALAALPQVAQLAVAYDAGIILLHVQSSPWVDWVTSGLTDGETHRRMDSWRNDLCTRGARVDDTQLLRGSAAPAILEYAESVNAGLIAIGSGDKSLIDRFTTGATAEAVARAAEVPVWVVRPGAREKIERVLCGVDTTEASARVLEAALLLRQRLAAKLTVAYVVSKLERAGGIHPGGEQEELQRYERERREAYARLLEHYGRELTDVERLCVIGRPSESLRGIAMEEKFDLIMVGRAESSRLARLLLGSTAERLLRHSPCSLLLADGAVFEPLAIRPR
ncbi:MAG TPA: universal stress protein [Polyangiaceae bacterium]